MIPATGKLQFYLRKTRAENKGKGSYADAKQKVSRQPFDLFDLLGKNWNSVKEISNNAVIRYIKDWSFGIFIDGDNRAGVFHTYEMLDGSGNPKCHIELWSNGLT